MRALAWLARVGPASGGTWAKAIGWQEPTMRSHLVRLDRAGLLARAMRFHGSGGPLVYATALGVQMTGVRAAALRRAPAPVTWAHHEATAEMAALLTIRGRAMLAPRELLVDEHWVGVLEWREHGELRRRRHRPDLVATVADGRSMAIEVELSAKSPERLRSILSMYTGWLASGRLDSLLYVVGAEREQRLLSRRAAEVGLRRGPTFTIQRLDQLHARINQESAGTQASVPRVG
jgi:hypothetical protein